MSTLALLQEVAEFLEDYSDVRDGDDGAPVPNRAMSLLCEVEREIEKLTSRAVMVDTSKPQVDDQP